MKSSKSGFTLLETVTALALASAGLAAVYQVYASAARAELAASEAVTASRLAENLLTTPQSQTSGEANGFTWDLTTAQVEDQPELQRFTLELISESGREFVFSLEQLAPAEDIE